MEELCSGEGSHKRVDPHRHYEKHDRYCAAVEILVCEDPCCRIAEQDAQGCVFNRHFKREGECLYGICVSEELDEVAQREVAAAVRECVEQDQDQRERHEKQQEDCIGECPGTSSSHCTLRS